MTDSAAEKPNVPLYRGNPDFLTGEGATELVRRLTQFWDRETSGNCGTIKFSVEQAGSVTSANKIVFGVRSNLVNGLPPR